MKTYQLSFALCAALFGTVVHSQSAIPAMTPATSPAPAPVDAGVSEARLRADIDTLVGFGTRHTLSDQAHPTRGIGAARRWAEAEFRRISADCGGCLSIELPEEMVTGARVPTPTRLVNVLGVQRGSDRPDEVVIISAHIDSRVSDVMNTTADAPGANDDGSGTAAVIEAARVLSRHRYPVTIVYAVLSGEEQGLFGGRLLARHAAAQGWTVTAVLNNDIIGGSRGSDGVRDDAHVRVFSEGARADSTDAIRAAARREGGENDSPSRNISRWIDALATARGLPIAVRQVWRADRFGRGGDQLPSQEAGYPAVRLSVAIEDYDHQHQDVRTDGGTFYGDVAAEMDFPYLARVTRLNVAALDGLARAPRPPAVSVVGAVSTDTTLTWGASAGAAQYRVYHRRTDARDWSLLPTTAYQLTTRQTAVSDDRLSITLPDLVVMTAILRGTRVDDWVFGVSAVAADCSESPVSSAVPGGAFVPVAR